MYKCKAIPLQAWTDPEVSRRLRLQDFKTIGTALQVGKSRVRFPMVSLEFFIDIILPTALWPWS